MCMQIIEGRITVDEVYGRWMDMVSRHNPN